MAPHHLAFSALLLLLILISSKSNSDDKSKVVRDGSLKSIAKLLNAQPQMFKDWSGHEDDYRKFLEVLLDWTIGDVPVKLKSKFRMFDSKKDLNCADPTYENVLTGKKLAKERVIVDFIPFGYDVDKLEIRLHDTFNAVDCFVIYESPRTLSGLAKPMYFPMIMHSDRFRPYLSKIIHLNATFSDIQQQTLKVRRSVGTAFKSGNWELDFAMRTEMVKRFNAVQNSALKAFVMSHLQGAYGIQNDADEIVNGKVLYHVKHCEIKREVDFIFAPSFAFKKNFHWLQNTVDLGCLKGSNINDQTEKLRFHLWRPGPYIWPLGTILRENSTLRYHKYEGRECQHHLGLGAATHMSSLAEPVMYWLKRCGVNEQSYKGAVSPELVRAGRDGAITPELIYASTISPYCSKWDVPPARHISTHTTQAQDIWLKSIPQVVTDNPSSFPFLLPGLNGPHGTVGLMSRSADSHWSDLCSLSNATAM